MRYSTPTSLTRVMRTLALGDSKGTPSSTPLPVHTARAAAPMTRSARSEGTDRSKVR